MAGSVGMVSSDLGRGVKRDDLMAVLQDTSKIAPLVTAQNPFLFAMTSLMGSMAQLMLICTQLTSSIFAQQPQQNLKDANIMDLLDGFAKDPEDVPVDETPGTDIFSLHKQLEAEKLAKFDFNKNGQIDPEEDAAYNAYIAAKTEEEEDLKKFDIDGNGVLDDAEKAAKAAYEAAVAGPKEPEPIVDKKDDPVVPPKTEDKPVSGKNPFAIKIRVKIDGKETEVDVSSELGSTNETTPPVSAPEAVEAAKNDEDAEVEEITATDDTDTADETEIAEDDAEVAEETDEVVAEDDAEVIDDSAAEEIDEKIEEFV